MSDLKYGYAARAGRRQSGVTLVELLIVLIMTAILATAIAYAFGAEVRMQRAQETRRAGRDETDMLERTITQLLAGARLSTSATDLTTYFQGIDNGGGGQLGTDRITFTTNALGVPMASMNDTTDDFNTQSQSRGPVGGLAEISLSTTPVGDAGAKTGLFERVQRPSDGDPTQGGTESVLDSNVSQIGFQFWDGLEWTPTWDTTTMTTRRLPAAVQVSYILTNDTTNTVHMFVVAIPTSDVTALNPVTSTGSATSTATSVTGP